MDARFIIACLAGMASLPACALDLKGAWDLLQTQAPNYLAAQHERDAGLENRAIGRAGLLPLISASASRSHINGTREQDDVIGRRAETDLNYNSDFAGVRLRQPLLNLQKLTEYREGQQKAKLSEAIFDAKTQQLAVTLSGRYFDVLLTRETIDLADAKLKAFEQQVAAAQRRFDLGDGAITDVDQAVARRDLAQAELIEAKDNHVIALRLLQEILGGVPENIAALRQDFPTPPLQPATLPEWLTQTLANNPTVRARLLKRGLSEEDINLAKSGHWPTLDLVLGYTDSESDTVATLNQKNRYSSAGLEFNLPLFAGGGTSARVRQAIASNEQASEELNAAREEAVSATTREFRGVLNGEKRIRALERAVVSNERAQDSARKGFLAGSSTNLDILNAEEQIFTARRDLLEAKLRYLLARLQLAVAVGMLGDDDIAQANAYLGPQLAIAP